MAKRFRLLKEGEIECRISQVSKDGKGVSLLLYKTARTDAALLDETFGAEFWENDFKLIDGTLYGGIGIDYDRAGERMIWKWDCGTESNTEQEKGRASDAFKRAGFKHGIGRELYSAPFIYIPGGKCKKLNETKRQDRYGNNIWECKDKFTVVSIGYDSADDINHLMIANQDGDIVFEMGDAPKDGRPVCENCGRPITHGWRRDGSVWPVEDIVRYTTKKCDRPLCITCGREATK